jgi:hypothetical protein
MFLVVSSDLQGTEITFKKCTFVIPDNICFCSMIRNFEGKNIVTLYRIIANFELCRVMIR